MTKKKATPTSRYEAQRETYVERVLCYLLDCHLASPEARSVAVTAVRSFLHMSSAGAWTEPILGSLKKRGLVTISDPTGQGTDRTVYFTERFVKLAEEPAGGRGNAPMDAT
jgi:hypothetical protein